ncbi:MAG: DUF2953 domain-containing protein [Lachnospiraceae bacterium]|nr:DUF2953 domain-containing protein [Lachnospiraceae bacterium]
MLHILLSILAVIGKLLLGILGMILLLLLLILFVPVRYRGRVRKQEKELAAEGTVSWLFRGFSVQVAWEEKKLSYELRILWIPVLRLLEWIKKKKAEKKKHSVQREETASLENRKEESEPETEMNLPEEKSESEEEKDLLEEKSEPETEMNLPEEETEPETKTPSPEEVLPSGENGKKKTGFTNRIKRLGQVPGKVKRQLQAALEKAKSVLTSAEQLKEKVDRGRKLLQSRTVREAVTVAGNELIAVLRHILPRKLWGEVEYGTGDPGTTGEILAAVAAVYPVLPGELRIRPDFEEAVLNGDLSLKGRIRLATVLFHGIRMILNRQIRKVIKLVRRKEAW